MVCPSESDFAQVINNIVLDIMSPQFIYYPKTTPMTAVINVVQMGDTKPYQVINTTTIQNALSDLTGQPWLVTERNMSDSVVKQVVTQATFPSVYHLYNTSISINDLNRSAVFKYWMSSNSNTINVFVIMTHDSTISICDGGICGSDITYPIGGISLNRIIYVGFADIQLGGDAFKGEALTRSGITDTIIHELGHSAGLNHPFLHSYFEDFVDTPMAYYAPSSHFTQFEKDYFASLEARIRIEKLASQISPLTYIFNPSLIETYNKALSEYSVMQYGEVP